MQYWLPLNKSVSLAMTLLRRISKNDSLIYRRGAREPLIKAPPEAYVIEVGGKSPSEGGYGGENSQFQVSILPKGRRNPRREIMNRPP